MSNEDLEWDKSMRSIHLRHLRKDLFEAGLVIMCIVAIVWAVQ